MNNGERDAEIDNEAAIDRPLNKDLCPLLTLRKNGFTKLGFGVLKAKDNRRESEDRSSLYC